MINTFSKKAVGHSGKSINDVKAIDTEKLKSMKVGVLVRNTMTVLLENGLVSEGEIEQMQNKSYCKTVFDLQFPVLRKASLSNGDRPLRYWAGAVEAFGVEYFMCSEWYETAANNDRPYYTKWLLKKTEG